jgi:CheY-like chemotaxis protein
MTSLPLPLSPSSAADRSAARPTVLVVDDDIIVLQTLQFLLEDNGFTVLTAVDGVQGLREYRKHRPDLVLTDIVMPEKEGIALIRELRREFPDAKVVAMSGGGRVGNSDYVSIALALGANLGLDKPFDDLELVESLRRLLGSSPASAENSEPE